MAQERTLPPITIGGEDYVDSIADVLTAAFGKDAFSRAINQEKHKPWNEEEHNTTENRRPGFREMVKEDQEAGALLVEAGGYGFVGVWFPPDKHVPHRDPSEMPNPILREYVEQLEPIKDKFLRGRPHWYCHFLGRQPERRDPGLARAVIAPYVQKAHEEGVPVWIEASNAYAMGVYEYFGFRNVGFTYVGKGKVNAQGYPEEGGEGLTMYCMLYEPEA